MEAYFQDVSGWLATRPHWISFAICVVAFVESLALAGVVVPGVAMLFAIAAVAGNTGFSLWAALGWAAIGAIAGDSVSFALGKWLKERVHQLWPFSRYPGMIERGERFFRQHGGKSVVVGRFVGPIRPVIPLVAGTFDMSGRRFLAFNLFSALGWAPLYVLPGYIVGASIALDMTLPAHFYPILFASLGTLLLVFVAVLQVHWSLGEGGVLYRILQRLSTSMGPGARFWQAMQRPRPGQPEFPLPSLALAVATTALFALWSIVSLETHWLNPIDQAGAAFFGGLRNPLIDPAFIAFTLAGDARVMWWSFGLLIAYLLISRHFAAALHVAAAGLVVLLVTHGLKASLGVERPDLVTHPPDSLAYPSGHASGNTVFFGLVAAYIAQEWPIRRRWRVYTLASLPVLLIALSRLYLGVHWFTDVIGGVLLGLAICGWVRFSFSRYDDRPLPLHRHTYQMGALWLAGVLAYAIWQWDAAVVAYRPL